MGNGVRGRAPVSWLRMSELGRDQRGTWANLVLYRGGTEAWRREVAHSGSGLGPLSLV